MASARDDRRAGRTDAMNGRIDPDKHLGSGAYRKGQQDGRTAKVDRELRDWDKNRKSGNK